MPFLFSFSSTIQSENSITNSFVLRQLDDTWKREWRCQKRSRRWIWNTLYVRWNERRPLPTMGCFSSAGKISVEVWKRRTRLSSRFDGRDVRISLFAAMHICSGLFGWTCVFSCIRGVASLAKMEHAAFLRPCNAYAFLLLATAPLITMPDFPLGALPRAWKYI